MTVRFCPIGSGSNGNCTYIGAGGTHILIDAGFSGARVEKGLAQAGVSCADISAIFITHEHSDHIQGAGILSRRYGFPLFATEKTWERIDRHNMLGRVAPALKRAVRPGEACHVGDVTAEPFNIPHDCAEPVGYRVYAGGRKITVATDIGHVTETVREGVAGCDLLLLESNYDEDMLKNGRYPAQLKRRVAGPGGHLSNAAAGLLLADIARGGPKTVFLGHMSEENNLPLLAMDTVSGILAAGGVRVGEDIRLMMAHRGCVSEMVEL